MTKCLAVLTALLMTGAVTQSYAAEATSKAEWEKCAARIRKDMPIPPANEGAIQLTIQSICGTKPAK